MPRAHLFIVRLPKRGCVWNWPLSASTSRPTSKLLAHRGVLVEEQGVTYLAERDGDGDDAHALTALQSATRTYRIAWGSGAGQKVASLQGALPQAARLNPPLCATAQGFSLHAAVRCGSDERQVLEQLCRYVTRPALANERVRCNRAGQVVLKLKTVWHDGTTHLVLSPLQFMPRLAALVPRPRLHLIRFHGVLATNAKLRALVIPAGPDHEAEAASACTSPEPGCAHRRVTAIVELPVIERILTHLGLAARPPPRAPARSHRRLQAA